MTNDAIIEFNLKALEKAFREQEPECLSCGWGACFYELGPWVQSADNVNEWSAACVSKDDPDCGTHRGVFVYVESDK